MIFFARWTPRDLLVAGVQAGVPGYSVNLLLFTYWYFSSGHLRFSGRWCPNLNLVKISLSLSRLKTTHILTHYTVTWKFKISGKTIYVNFHVFASKHVYCHLIFPVITQSWQCCYFFIVS